MKDPFSCFVRCDQVCGTCLLDAEGASFPKCSLSHLITYAYCILSPGAERKPLRRAAPRQGAAKADENPVGPSWGLFFDSGGQFGAI